MRAAAASLLAAVSLFAPGTQAAGGEKATASRIVFGESVGGRDLVARRVGPGDGARTVLVVGEVHGNEEAGRTVVRSLRRDRGRARGLTIWTVDSVNPDGHEENGRTNSRGVDLNRNFPVGWTGAGAGTLEYGGPRPFSEPESRGYRDLVRELDPDVTILFHQPWGAVLAPCDGPVPLQRRYARASGMELDRCRGEELPGTMTRWQNSRGGTAFVVELAAGSLGSGKIRRHAAAVRALAAG